MKPIKGNYSIEANGRLLYWNVSKSTAEKRLVNFLKRKPDVKIKWIKH